MNENQKPATHPYVLGEALNELVRDQSAWSQATFGTDAERGPVGALKHLAKEVFEAEAAFIMNKHCGGDRGIIAEELADCFLLILDASRRAGLTPLELLEAAAQKMIVNKARSWPKTTGDVPSEHAREPTVSIGGAEQERDRLREALTWAVEFIQCNVPGAAERYPDMRNAQDLMLAYALPTGEFQRISAQAELAEEQVNELKRFKDYVHQRLDIAGVTPDPDSPHKAAGCRIGGRLDELIGERDRLRAALERVRTAVSAN